MRAVAKLIDGRQIAQQFRKDLARRIKQRLLAAGKRVPGLAVILLGANPASQIYVRHKQRACQEVGLMARLYHLEDSTSEADLINLIKQLNGDSSIDGILVQLPLPAGINAAAIREAIHPQKDVDGLHPYNLGRLCQSTPQLRPCTPYGIMHLLWQTGIKLAGLHAVVVGASNIVGRPMAMELLLAGCSVTTVHRSAQDLSLYVRQADLLVCAVGQEQLIAGEWIKPGAVVIDVGINRRPDGAIVGDVDFAKAAQRASWITPVPGGVGPMTVAMLIHNTLFACEQFHENGE